MILTKRHGVECFNERVKVLKKKEVLKGRANLKILFCK